MHDTVRSESFGKRFGNATAGKRYVFHGSNPRAQAKRTVEWRRGRRQDEERQLLSLFADDPSAPFSIHRFVEHGASACGKHPGEWFGPSATARCIQ